MNDADPGELNHWAALFLDKFRAVPGITDVTTDQLNAGPMLDITIKRDVASSYGILPYTIDNTLDDAFGQRIVCPLLRLGTRPSRSQDRSHDMYRSTWGSLVLVVIEAVTQAGRRTPTAAESPASSQ